MRFANLRIAGATLAVAALTLLTANGASAQSADVAGHWVLTVTTDTGTTTPSLTLEQDGMTLTGHYSSETLGDADVTGTVDGSDITVSLTASLQGQEIPVVYKATLGDDGTLSGTIDVGGGLATGTFTATKSEQ